MQLTSLLVCFMTMAPVVIHAAPIPSSDVSLGFVKRVATPAKPATKPAAKPAAKPAPVAAKPVAAPIKPPAKPAPVPAKPAPVPAKPAPAPAKPPTTKPPPAAPVKNPPKPSTSGGTSKPGLGTTPPGGDADVCSGLSKRVLTPPCSCFNSCNSCTAQANCAFNTQTFKCVNKADAPADSKIIGPQPGTAGARCIAVNQQSSVFPPIEIKGKGKKGSLTPAGLPTDEITKAFEEIKNHIFTLDNKDPKRQDSGQHLKSVWIANHTGNKAVPTCNPTTGLCTFNDGSQTGKTVWNDDPGFYTKREVQNMCSVALILAQEKGVAQHVVMSPLGKKICIFASKRSATKFNKNTGAGEGSCFPVGTEEETILRTNDPC